MSHVFISYRRDDSAATCGRIYDRLVSHFGREAIFIDVDNIPLGVNFEQYIAGAMQQCSVLLAVIGSRWLDVTDASGQPRIQDPNDVVRLEIEAALHRHIPVIPVLVQGAQIPPSDRLPESLQSLRMQNGLPVRDDRDFDNDIRHLVSSLESWIPRRPNPGPAPQAPLTGQQPFAQPVRPPMGNLQQPVMGQPQPMGPTSFGQPFAAPPAGPAGMGAPAGQLGRQPAPSIPVNINSPVTPTIPVAPSGAGWGQAAPPAPPPQPVAPQPMPIQPANQPFMPAQQKKTNVGLIAGIVGGVLVLVCVGSLVLIAAIGAASGGTTSTPTATTGSTGGGGAAIWTVEMQQANTSTTYNGYSANAGHYFVLAQMVVENSTTAPQIFRSDYFSLKDSTGQIYSESQASNPGQAVSIDPGQTATLTFSYLVPDSECQFKLYFIPPDQSSQKTWDITAC